jgi:putative DNA modification/repair radical SAM protein
MNISEKIKILCKASAFDTCASSASPRNINYKSSIQNNNNYNTNNINHNSLNTTNNPNNNSRNNNNLNNKFPNPLTTNPLNNNYNPNNPNQLNNQNSNNHFNPHINQNNRIGDVALAGICHAFSENGRCISLFKTLMTNSCFYDCKYCHNSSGCQKKPTSFEPEELAKIVIKLYVTNHIEGLFLSSGVCKDADRTMEKMLETVKLLRNKYNFQGYIHLKILPGTSRDLINEAAKITDRLSINIETPNKSRMSSVSSLKDYHIDILRRQRWIKETKVPAGQTTQMVVGGSDETDYEILKMVDWEYKNLDLKRAYYSAFTPVEKTPLSEKQKVPLERENKLYNVDFLMRKYNFKLNEFKNIMNEDMLPKGDPKIHIANNYFDSSIDVNSADYNDLIRVPGIGLKSAERIIEIRKTNYQIKKKEELSRIGVVLKRATPYLKIDGYTQKRVDEYG